MSKQPNGESGAKQGDNGAEHNATPPDATQDDNTERDASQQNNGNGQTMGDVTHPPEPAGTVAGETPTREESQADASRRWRNEGIDGQVAAFRDRCRSDYLEDHPGCKRRDAHEYAWRRALAEFPPPGVEPAPIPEPEPVEPIAAAPVAPDPGVSGLGSLPAGWPDLPSNASLQGEIAWVQANRLRIVRESATGTAVDLSHSLSPAPSHAALGWLETSCRAYSKYCDIAARATAQQEHEAEAVRRERLALGDVVTLLESMADGA